MITVSLGFRKTEIKENNARKRKRKTYIRVLTLAFLKVCEVLMTPIEYPSLERM